MGMPISKGLSFLGLVAIFICLLFIEVADAHSGHSGTHAVEKPCPGGGDHCHHSGRMAAQTVDEDDDFDDTYKVPVKGRMAMSMSESTEDAEERAVEMEMETTSPEEPVNQKVVVLGH